ncbi:hypothetical protein FKM82_002224 [Ascaphus truei]
MIMTDCAMCWNYMLQKTTERHCCVDPCLWYVKSVSGGPSSEDPRGSLLAGGTAPPRDDKTEYPVIGLGVASTYPLPDYNVDTTLCELVAITSRILRKVNMMDKQFSHHRCKMICIRKVWKRTKINIVIRVYAISTHT